MKGKSFCAGEQRGNHLKRWIFCGRTDEDDRSLFHMGEESILLSLVESMDFIDKENRPFFMIFPFFIRLLNDLLDFFHPGENSAEGEKLSMGGGGNDHGEGRLAGPRSPPNKHRWKRIGFD